MTTTRILLKQHEVLYRFLRLEARPDGSLILLIDRDPSEVRGAVRSDGSELAPIKDIEGKVLPHNKFSIHATGQVNYYSRGQKPRITYYEPLATLTKPVPVCIYSVPSVERLDKFDPASDIQDARTEIYIPDEFVGRFSFEVAVIPEGWPRPNAFTLNLHYEIYDVAITQVPPFVPVGTENHFVTAVPEQGAYPSRQMDIANAELSFHRKRLAGAPAIYWLPQTGQYLCYAAVPMAKSPKLEVEFNQPDLQIEQVPFEANAPVTHKVRFWIKRKGSRVKDVDLREHIVSLMLDAELY